MSDPEDGEPSVTLAPLTVRVGVGAAIALAAGLIVVLVMADARVRQLEAGEVSASSEVITASDAASARLPLVSAELRRDDEVVFELCSDSALAPELWDRRLEVAIVRRGEPDEDVLRSRLDAPMLAAARRAPERGTCLDVGRGVIELDGRYATELAWDDGLPEPGVRFRARTLGRRALTVADRNLVLGLLLLSLLFTLALYTVPLAPLEGSPVALVPALAIAAGAAAVLFLFMRYVTPLLPGGASGGLASGLLLALLEVVLAATLLVRARDRLAVLGVGRLEVPVPSRWERARPYLLLVLAPVAGFILFRIAGMALRFVPATGEAPIEAFVSSPSGMLSFATLAVLAPVAEEVFFRGLVYGVLRGDGAGYRPLIAFAGAWVIFALVHLPQTWGSWGGTLSIAIAALGFTALRALSGSVVVPAVAHLIYNGLLSAQALVSASS